MFPTLSEAITHQRITVAAPFFNRWMLPLGLTLLVLTGVTWLEELATVGEVSDVLRGVFGEYRPS